MKRRSTIRRASTWWLIGLGLHVLWLAFLLLSFNVTAIRGSITEWAYANRPANAGGPSYIYGLAYIVNGTLGIFALAMVVCVAAAVLSIRQRRADRRLFTGMCPHCGYPVGTSPVCTECGEPVPFQV